MPITLAKGVELKVDGNSVTVKGPKGSLSLDLQPRITVEQGPEGVQISAASADRIGCGAWLPMCIVRCRLPSSQSAMQPRVSIGRCVMRCWMNVVPTTRYASATRRATSPASKR